MCRWKKFVLKNKLRSNTKKFFIIEGKAIVAFVPKAGKFSDCESHTDVTEQISCKVPGIETIGTPNVAFPPSCGSANVTESIEANLLMNVMRNHTKLSTMAMENKQKLGTFETNFLNL